MICTRCEHSWKSRLRSGVPVCCPKCKSTLWNKDRVNVKGQGRKSESATMESAANSFKRNLAANAEILERIGAYEPIVYLWIKIQKLEKEMAGIRPNTKADI